MIKFFRLIRKRLLSQNKFGKYLIYALGEIVLVVIGILIAIQINEWNRDRKLYQVELESYQLIITDLKRDSTLFKDYQVNYSNYLDTYFQINNIKKGQSSFKNLLPDYLVMNIEFNPVTQKNHQASIEKFRNGKIREQISNYFRRLSQVAQATDEFNDLVVEESRPFFLKENNVLDNDKVFDNNDKTFPPLKGVSTIDTLKLKETFNHTYFLPILSELRMSIGFYLASLNRSIEENHRLIQDLQSRFK
jgi:hypothetical protein